MNVKDLCDRLGKTSWVPPDSRGSIANPKELDGILNLAWALAERPKLSAEFFSKTDTRAIWFLCCHLAAEDIDGVKVGEYAMLMPPQVLLGLVLDNEELFKAYLPTKTWIKALKP